ncbi:MAG: NADH oxidase, partial [Rhodospirillaceae bacterium]|nr:NADH oxidase [Rhodospirillaceae bacterium]
MALELRSTIKTGGSLEITLAEVEIPEPKDNQVVVRVEATPINPSDLGLLFGAADMTTARFSGDGSGRVVTADVPEGLMNSMAGRLDQSLPVGNEGAGVVVKAGASDMAQALMGKTVSIIGGAMYAEYKAVRVDQCLEMPAGVTPAQGASWFVNPMTAQGMVETMR